MAMETASTELRKESRGQRPATIWRSFDDRPASKFTAKHIHLIGIGGSGMSGLAAMLLDSGAVVTGSEPKPNEQTRALIDRGATISQTQTGQLISDQVDLVVRTAAVKDSNSEFLAAVGHGLKTVKYAEMLGQVMQERFGVAIAGTHGKSTTTAMTAYALVQCGADPSFVVGGTVPQLGGGSRSGLGRAFVAEACEFDRSFHSLRPTVAVITNIEADHLDCYKNLEEIIESFHTFAELVLQNGLILFNGADANVGRALAGLTAPRQSVSLKGDSDWLGRIRACDRGCCDGDLYFRGKWVARLRLSVSGEHNFFDAMLAVAACAACGVDPAQAAEALADFRGVDRRMTEVGQFQGATLVDDYGHHPTEIRITLDAIRQRYAPKRLICVFQPHQHSRTRLLLDEFATCFASADLTVISDIYAVRDSQEERQRISASDLVDRVQTNGQRVIHLPTFDQITEYLREEVHPGDVIVTMGAGTISQLGRDLIYKSGKCD